MNKEYWKAILMRAWHAVWETAAAISSVPKHTAFMLTDDGYVLESRCFRHEQEVTNERKINRNI